MSTIAAISTPRGVGGIAVIRISGENALSIADKIFRPVSTKINPSEMEGYTCAYGEIADNNQVYDDGVLTVFKAPKSYTGEDVVEISCHGGIFVTEEILNLILNNGAVLAEPGEFTKRAFLNGKMGLTQAEAVMDIISAEGGASQRCAVALRKGALFSHISSVSAELLHLLSKISAWVDYPEDDIPEIDRDTVIAELNKLVEALEIIIATYDYGRILRQGVDTVIVGKPNVGKSTIMNLLSGCERSIVTNVAGTTRDIVVESIRLGDIVLRLSDTAGIRETDDIVEGVGVKRANDKINTAELILVVFDYGDELSSEDVEIISRCKGRNCVAVINKTDKENKLDISYIEENFPKREIVYISAGNGEGILDLQSVLEDKFKTYCIDYDAGILANERQKQCVQNALKALKESIDALYYGETLDVVNIIIDEAENYLLELTGERASEAVVNEVFSRFCVGK